MEISVFLTLFFVSIPIILSHNLTKFLNPQRFLLVDAVVELMEESYIIDVNRFSVSATPTCTDSLHTIDDMISKLLQSLKTRIKYLFTDKEIFRDRGSVNNVVVLYDYNDFRFAFILLNMVSVNTN